jgi:endonuclease III
MYELAEQQKQQLEALIREATFKDVKTGDVINIFAMLQNLQKTEKSDKVD